MVVDDEIEIADMIEDFLRLENIEVIKASSGEMALELLNDDVKLLVLDINMNGMNGIELCKKIRKKNFTPVIFLTCNNSQNDMLLGLGVGADDYITAFYDENLVNTTIKRLRKKIENNPEKPEYIKTIWGAGYVFEGSVR